MFRSEPCAIAVSGGGDSLALALLAIEAGLQVSIYHFNHNLRTEAGAEEVWLKTLFEGLNVPFYSATWQPKTKPDQGRLQAEARNARYKFFTKQSNALGVQHVLLGHTANDVAETMLMRLFYGSGPQGLKPMAVTQQIAEGVKIHRPLLQVNRDALRTYLRAKGQPWLEDPSNANPAFVRVRARYWVEKLNMVETLCALSANFNALDQALQPLGQPLVLEQTAKDAAVDAQLLQQPTFVQERVVKGLVKDLTGNYPPRTAQIGHLLAHLQESAKPYQLAHLQWQRKGGVVHVQALQSA